MNVLLLELLFLAQAAPVVAPAVTVSPTVSPWFYLFYFLSPFIAPCITVGLGGWLIQRSFVSRANASAFVDALVKRMDEILADSLEYWNIHQPDAIQEKRAKILAQKIKGSVRSLNSDLTHFRDKYARKETFESNMLNIFDMATGGSFESTPRTADPDRYLLIVNQVNELKSKLLRVKL